MECSGRGALEAPMTPFVKKLILTAVTWVVMFVVLKYVIHRLLDVWWADMIIAAVVAGLVYKNVSLAQIQKAEADLKANVG